MPSGWPGFHRESKETFIRKNQSWCHQAWSRKTCFLSPFVAPWLLGTTALPRNPSGGGRPLLLSLQCWQWLGVRGFRSRSPWRCEWSQSQNQSHPLHSFPQKLLAPSVEDRPQRSEVEKRVDKGSGEGRWGHVPGITVWLRGSGCPRRVT